MSASRSRSCVADSAALAEDALEAIALDIESLPRGRRPRRRAQRRRAAVRGHRHATSHHADGASKATPTRRSRDAPYTRREHFSGAALHRGDRWSRAACSPNGTTREAHLTVSGTTKVAFPNRRILAKQMGLPEDAITMIEADVGGGFGVRGEFYPEDFLIPFAARMLGRPVKWIEDRREHLIATNHARDAECELEIACERDGTILGLRGTARPTSAPISAPTAPPRRATSRRCCPGRTACRTSTSTIALLVTNKTPVGTYRGPGRFEADFFRERLFDMAANDLGIDRVEFRRRNLVAESEMPYPLPTVQPLDQGTRDRQRRLPQDARPLPARFRLGRESDAAGQADRRPLPRHRGRLLHRRRRLRPARERRASCWRRDGTVSLYIGSSSVGQGLETVFAQIAADALEMPMARINRVLHGSTNYVKQGFGSYSLALDRDGRLGHRAGGGLSEGRDPRRRGEAPALRAERHRDRRRQSAVGPNRASVALSALAADGIAAEGTFRSNKRTYSYGAHAAHVAVDPGTGHVALIDYMAVEDVGRIINPLTLHGQTLGAIVQGLGGALLEHLVYDADGQFLTGSLADYLMPTASDFPSSARMRWRTSPRRTTRSAPKARAKAASSRSAA